jgi:hypothetical protein
MSCKAIEPAYWPAEDEEKKDIFSFQCWHQNVELDPGINLQFSPSSLLPWWPTFGGKR